MTAPASAPAPFSALPPAAFLAAIVDSSDDALISKDLNGVIMSWNRGAERIFGYTAEETIGRSVLMLFPPDRQHEEPAVLARIRAGEKVDHYETIRRTKTGRLIEVSLTVSPIRNAEGRIIGAAKVARELSSERRVNQAQRLLAAIVESSDDAIISKDLNGIITSWNRGAELLFGYAPVEVIGRSIMVIIPPERAAEEQSIIARVRRGEKVAHTETVRRHKNGTLLDISVTVSPIRNVDGEIIGASKIARDISARKREELIRASLQEKEVLLKEIHHRVKNNLQITSSLLKLQAEHIRDPQARDFFVESQNRIRSMALVHEKLYQAQNLSRIDVREYAESLGHLLVRSLGNGQTHVKLDVFGSHVLLGITAAVPCGLILNELISNALKHAFPAQRIGQIRVRVDRDTISRETVLSVSDNGVGLPPEFNLASSRSLGMQLVQTLTGQLNGTLRINPRDWTEFEVRFLAP